MINNVKVVTNVSEIFFLIFFVLNYKRFLSLINSWEVPFVNVTFNKNFQTNIKSENKITKMSVYFEEKRP